MNCMCCGKETKNPKYCSRSCAAKINGEKYPKKPRVKNKTCLICNALFKPTHKSSKYCSRKCFNLSVKSEIEKNIKDGNASAWSVKRYLIENHGNICMDENCAWDFSARPINVELEHKDGNHENNTLENCILLCPNCHSTTSTYKFKNKGNGRHNRMIRRMKGKSY